MLLMTAAVRRALLSNQGGEGQQQMMVLSSSQQLAHVERRIGVRGRANSGSGAHTTTGKTCLLTHAPLSFVSMYVPVEFRRPIDEMLSVRGYIEK